MATHNTPLPEEFASIEDVQEFWDTHSTAEYWDEMEDVNMGIFHRRDAETQRIAFCSAFLRLCGKNMVYLVMVHVPLVVFGGSVSQVLVSEVVNVPSARFFETKLPCILITEVPTSPGHPCSGS